MKKTFEFKHGGKSTITIDDQFIRIARRGLFNRASGLTGEKVISLESITSVQFKAPSLQAGYIQFTIPGGGDEKKGVNRASTDEKAILFSKKELRMAEEIRNYVESYLTKKEANKFIASDQSISDELRKLAALRDEGILTDDEFQEQKQKLLK